MITALAAAHHSQFADVPQALAGAAIMIAVVLVIGGAVKALLRAGRSRG